MQPLHVLPRLIADRRTTFERRAAVERLAAGVRRHRADPSPPPPHPQAS